MPTEKLIVTSQSINQGLSLDHLTESLRTGLVLAVLQWIEKQDRLPLEIYEASLKTRPTTGLELVVVFLDEKEEGPKILLQHRDIDDVNFPDHWCCPGSGWRPNYSLDKMLEILNKPDETGLSAPVEVHLAGVVNITNKRRAHYVNPIGLMVFKGQVRPDIADTCRWVPVSQLDKYNLVTSHKEAIIPAALEVLNGGTPKFWESATPANG